MLNSEPFKIDVPFTGAAQTTELTVTPMGDNLFEIDLNGNIIGKALKTLEDWEQVEADSYALSVDVFDRIARKIDEHYLEREITG